MGSILHHITPLIINKLWGTCTHTHARTNAHTHTHARTHTHTHTQTHTHIHTPVYRHSQTDAILRNQAHAWFNNLLYSTQIHVINKRWLITQRGTLLLHIKWRITFCDWFIIPPNFSIFLHAFCSIIISKCKIYALVYSVATNIKCELWMYFHEVRI